MIFQIGMSCQEGRGELGAAEGGQRSQRECEKDRHERTIALLAREQRQKRAWVAIVFVGRGIHIGE